MNEVLIRYLSDVFNAMLLVSGLGSCASFILMLIFIVSNCSIDHTMTWKEVLQEPVFRFVCIVFFICLTVFILTPQDFKHYFNLI